MTNKLNYIRFCLILNYIYDLLNDYFVVYYIYKRVPTTDVGLSDLICDLYI